MMKIEKKMMMKIGNNSKNGKKLLKINGKNLIGMTRMMMKMTKMIMRMMSGIKLLGFN
jgi:hypothetical protein